MRHIRLALASLFLLFAVPSVSFGDAAPAAALDAAPATAEPASEPGDAGPNALTTVTKWAIDLAFGLLTILGVWAGARGVGYFEKKTKIDVPAAVENQIDKWVEDGIGYAEEWAHKKAKEGTSKLTGPQKLETAVDFVLSFTQAKGWDDWARDTIEKKVEAKLGVKRS